MLQVFDAHFHIIDPRYPLVPNQGFLPEAFSCAAYLRDMQALELEPLGGAVVSGSFQAFDQAYLVAALGELGPGFAGVTQLPHTVSDARVLELHAAGVRAVRFNLFRGGSEEVDHLDALARRVFELAGWHVELYVDSRQLGALLKTLQALPRVSIDHLGLSRDGWPDLLKLAEAGVRVKATGFSRTDLDVASALQTLFSANPEALMFGSDLPCTRAPRAFDATDIALIRDALDEANWHAVFRGNAARWYGLQAG